MNDEIIAIINHSFGIAYRFLKWFIVQYIILFFTPFIWGEELGTGLAICIGIYTLLYAVFGEYVAPEKRIILIMLPLIPYGILSILCSIIWSLYFPSWYICILLPLYGAFCFLAIKSVGKILRQNKFRKWIISVSIILLLIILKGASVTWNCKNQNSIEGAKNEILQRRDYLLQKLTISPGTVLDEMPSEKPEPGMNLTILFGIIR